MTAERDAIMGETMLASALVMTLAGVLIERDPAFRPVIVDGIDNLLLQWERIAADPGHAIPGALAHARGRLERFLGELRGMASQVDS